MAFASELVMAAGHRRLAVERAKSTARRVVDLTNPFVPGYVERRAAAEAVRSTGRCSYRYVSSTWLVKVTRELGAQLKERRFFFYYAELFFIHTMRLSRKFFRGFRATENLSFTAEATSRYGPSSWQQHTAPNSPPGTIWRSQLLQLIVIGSERIRCDEACFGSSGC